MDLIGVTKIGWKKIWRRGAKGWHKNSATPKNYEVLGRTVTLGSDTVLPTLGSIWAGIIIDTLGSCCWVRYDASSSKLDARRRCGLFFIIVVGFHVLLLIYVYAFALERRRCS